MVVLNGESFLPFIVSMKKIIGYFVNPITIPWDCKKFLIFMYVIFIMIK